MLLPSQLANPSSLSRFSGRMSESSLCSASVFSGINQHLSFVFPIAENTFETLNDSLEDPSLDLGLESYSSQLQLLLKLWRRLKFRPQLSPQKSLHLSPLTALSTVELSKITKQVIVSFENLYGKRAVSYS